MLAIRSESQSGAGAKGDHQLGETIPTCGRWDYPEHDHERCRHGKRAQPPRVSPRELARLSTQQHGPFTRAVTGKQAIWLMMIVVCFSARLFRGRWRGGRSETRRRRQMRECSRKTSQRGWLARSCWYGSRSTCASDSFSRWLRFRCGRFAGLCWPPVTRSPRGTTFNGSSGTILRHSESLINS